MTDTDTEHDPCDWRGITVYDGEGDEGFVYSVGPTQPDGKARVTIAWQSGVRTTEWWDVPCATPRDREAGQ